MQPSPATACPQVTAHNDSERQSSDTWVIPFNSLTSGNVKKQRIILCINPFLLNVAGEWLAIALEVH